MTVLKQPPPSSIASLTADQRRLLSHRVNTISAVQRRNNERLSLLSQKPWTTSDPEIQRLLRGLREDNDAYAALVGTLADLIPEVYGNTSRAAALAKQVFGTFELLELIMMYLKPRRLLVAMCACKDMRDTALASTPVLRRMGLLPLGPGNVVCTPIVKYWPFAINIQPIPACHQTVSSAYTVQLTVAQSTTQKPEPLRFGERSREVLICQPPPKAMDLWTSCCCPMDPNPLLTGQWPPRPLETLRSERGVTVGMVVDAAERVSKEHRYCTSAGPDMKDETGVVRSALTFKAVVAI